jgi:hypothetical protein
LLRKESLEFGKNATAIILKILSRCVKQPRQKCILPVIKRSQLDDDKIYLRNEVADSTLCRPESFSLPVPRGLAQYAQQDTPTSCQFQLTASNQRDVSPRTRRYVHAIQHRELGN